MTPLIPALGHDRLPRSGKPFQVDPRHDRIAIRSGENHVVAMGHFDMAIDTVNTKNHTSGGIVDKTRSPDQGPVVVSRHVHGVNIERPVCYKIG